MLYIISLVFLIVLFLVSLHKILNQKTMEASIYSFELDKTKSVLLYIINKLDNADLLKVFKILYFAEQKHLKEYGNLIIFDKYIAMKNGPVPSFIYDLFKEVRGDRDRIEKNSNFYSGFNIKGKYDVIPVESSDLDYLSKSNIDCLELSIFENKDLSFDELSKKSHDSAWDSARKDDEIDFVEIAKAGGADSEMLKYVSECLSHRELISA